MNESQKCLHEKALSLSEKYRRVEAGLLKVLIEVDRQKIFRYLDRRSLFQYAVECLGLSEATAYSFIQVGRKSVDCPGLLKAIEEDKLSLSKANRICSVVSNKNCEHWVEFAATHSSREIEREVAKKNPKSRERMQVKHVAEDLVQLNLTVSRETFEMLERVAALNGSNLEQAVPTMAKFFLHHKDPVEKAKRNYEKTPRKTLHVQSIPAHTKHALFLKTQGRCMHVDPDGKRCNSNRHVEIHHIRPRSCGGGDELENLTVLCSFHHHSLHERSSAGSRRPSRWSCYGNPVN